MRDVTQKFIPLSRAIRKWRKDPEYVKEYDALELPFTIIAARIRANLSQAQLADRMGTTQAVIARLESGRTMPSTRTLERVAEATGHTLRISFEPAAKPKAKKRSGTPDRRLALR